jgi:hypothetical protein
MQRDLEQCLETMTPHATPRALGELVSGLFERERQQIHTIIEQQLRRLELVVSGAASSSRLSIPALTLEDTAMTPSAPSEISEQPPLAGWRRRRTAIVLLGSAVFLLLVGAIVTLRRSPVQVVSPKLEPSARRTALSAMSPPAAASITAHAVQSLAPSHADDARSPEPSAHVARRSSVGPAPEQLAPHVPAAPPQAYLRAPDGDDPLADRK